MRPASREILKANFLRSIFDCENLIWFHFSNRLAKRTERTLEEMEVILTNRTVVESSKRGLIADECTQPIKKLHSNLFVLLIAWKPDFLFLKIKSIFYLYVFQFSIGKKNLAKVTEQLSEDNIAYRRIHNRQLRDNDKTRKEEASNFHF